MSGHKPRAGPPTFSATDLDSMLAVSCGGPPSTEGMLVRWGEAVYVERGVVQNVAEIAEASFARGRGRRRRGRWRAGVSNASCHVGGVVLVNPPRAYRNPAS
jgi:hypothetical protein